MTSVELVDPEAQQRFEQAAVRRGEAEVVEGRVVFVAGQAATQSTVFGYEPGVQQVHELMVAAFARRAL